MEERIAALVAGELSPVHEALGKAGFQAYLVGGLVRDAFLNRSLEGLDVDIATDAHPDEIEKIVGRLGPTWLQGREFGTIGVAIGERHVEITTFRSDVYESSSRKPEVAFGDSIEEDLLRRDFTVNAMAINMADLTLVDPLNGVQHLFEKRLVTPAEPAQTFSEDPLRMLRAARFVAQIGFEVDPEAVAAIKNMNDRLEIVAAERIREEFSKLLVGERVGDALGLVVETGLADRFFPELPALKLEQDPIHQHKDVLAHTIAVTSSTSPRPRLRLAAVMHDIGKPRTRSYAGGKVSFHHHEVVGARMARNRLTELRYPTSMVDDVSELVMLHLRFHTYAMGWTDRAVRRYVRDAGPLLADLNELVRCDCTTRNKNKAAALNRRMDELEERIDVLSEQEELAKIRPPLDGNQVIEHLGLEPGPVIGDALDYLLELRLDHGPVEESKAYELLDEWAMERGLKPQ
ncbi:MAG: CCA tRNA nucleotidyltransferase [Acidobacteria bacterium]|nr:MAG: CCA tRNA nucleotidyltransferase [Acidobacteriota bacterium]